METRKFLLCVVAASLAAAAHAEIVTPNLAGARVNSNVSNAFPGLALRKLIGPNGAMNYAGTTENSVYRSPCTTYAACGYLSPAYSIGGNLFSAMDYRDCYDNSLNGNPNSCFYPFEVLQATFANPTDFVEFQFTWQSDPPAIFGYDAAGNEILACLPGGATGSPAGCMTSFQLSPGGDFIGTIRLTSPTAVIKRVVAGSAQGASRIIGLQYNNL